jgi:signal transduction histidine kinase
MELNLNYVRDKLLPDLLNRVMSGAGELEYDAAVFVNSDPAILIFESRPNVGRGILATADSSVILLPEARPGPPGPPGAGPLRREGGPGPPRLRDRRPDRPQPAFQDKAPDRSRSAVRYDGPDRPSPAEIGLDPGRPGDPDDPGPPRFYPDNNGRWRLSARHRAGSLEVIVERARRRNIVVSAGALLLILSTVMLLVRLSRQAERLAALQMNFVTGVSHELRTPLTVIRTASFNLRGGVANRPEQVEKYGKLIQEESEKLTALVEQVLLFARAKSGQIIQERRPVAVRELIDGSLSASMAAAEAQLSVEKSIEPNLPFVLVDEMAMTHALRNLIDNAIKYGTENNRWIGIFASIPCGEKDSAVEIRIADHGPGIPEDEQSHIFDAFFRGRRALENQVHGTGLGLNLAKKIIEANGGNLQVASAPATGTEFIVRLPIALEESST